jgi:prepilin-type N-terminal cleavage/methylation domain-containing protein
MPVFPPIFPDRKINLRVRAFTLVELLIAVSIFSVVSIAIYSTFSSGLSVLRRVKYIDFKQQKILLKQERFSRELRESCQCRKPLFLGNKMKISFCGIVDYVPSRITYYFDNASGSLMRNSDRLMDIITSEGSVEPELKSKPTVFVSGIKGARFLYLYLDLKKKTYSWSEEWTEISLPIAVKMIISTEAREYATTVFLPGA